MDKPTPIEPKSVQSKTIRSRLTSKPKMLDNLDLAAMPMVQRLDPPNDVHSVLRFALHETALAIAFLKRDLNTNRLNNIADQISKRLAVVDATLRAFLKDDTSAPAEVSSHRGGDGPCTEHDALVSSAAVGKLLLRR